MKPSETAILHITTGDPKFIPDYIAFLDRHFDLQEHHFLVLDRGQAIGHIAAPHTRVSVKRLWAMLRTIPTLRKYRKIVIHGLFDFNLMLALYLAKLDSSKMYWLPWGGDTYFSEDQKKRLKWKFRHYFRKKIVSQFGYAVMILKRDIELIRESFGFRGEWINCPCYPSNLVDPDQQIISGSAKEPTLLVGNSGYPTNNHQEVFSRIVHTSAPFERIYCPLSYGNSAYIREVTEMGRAHFGDRFVPLLDFVPKDQYRAILSKIDIAIFAQERQQGLGNAISLLSMGKKVYINPKSPLWTAFTDYGIGVFDMHHLELTSISECQALQNVKKCKEVFSEQKLTRQWTSIFA